MFASCCAIFCRGVAISRKNREERRESFGDTSTTLKTGVSSGIVSHTGNRRRFRYYGLNFTSVSYALLILIIQNHFLLL